MNAKLKVICLGVQVKLDRGEDLEIILASYTKLTSEEKLLIKNELNGSE